MEIIYTVSDCENVLNKLANLSEDFSAGVASVPTNSASQPADQGQSSQNNPQEATEQALIQNQQKLNITKDQLYERLLKEKDLIAKLKMRLVASGQQSPEDVERMEEPLGSGLNNQNNSPYCQVTGYTPTQLGSGLISTAALKKKSSILNYPYDAQAAYQNNLGYKGKIRSFLAADRVRINPFRARDEVEDAFRMDRNDVGGWLGGFYRGKSLDRVRDLYGDKPISTDTKYANLVLPKVDTIDTVTSNKNKNTNEPAALKTKPTVSGIGSKSDYNV